MARAVTITDFVGQVGRVHAKPLPGNDYIVHGVKSSSSPITKRMEYPYQQAHEESLRFLIHYPYIIDATKLVRLEEERRSDEDDDLAGHVPPTPGTSSMLHGIGATDHI